MKRTAASSAREFGGAAASNTAARRTRVIAECSQRQVNENELRGRSTTPSFLKGYFVMDPERRVVFRAPGRGTAEVRRMADDFIAERLAGERVLGQRHGNLGQARGKCALVSRCVEAQGFDVSQQGNPLLQSRLGSAHV